MSRGYTSNGKRLSAMTHASRGHECELCGRVVFGNGGQVSHGRGHVRRGEAVELVKHYAHPDLTPMRVFLPPDDERVAEYHARGFDVEGQPS